MTQTSRVNVDEHTIAGFGNQWAKYDQKDATEEEQQYLFDRYFSEFPWESLPKNSVGFDMGCGSGRWANLAAPKVGTLHCIDASIDALNVAKENLNHHRNCRFLCESVGNLSLENGTMDFGYSLGVLHHLPDTQAAIKSCSELLKPGAPLLIYLYYRFDNRPKWFQFIWKASELIRKGVTSLPISMRNGVCEILATTLYWPLARFAWLCDKLGLNTKNFPLSDYKNTSFYRMRHNARDRFGTPLEKRFTKAEIKKMMEDAGLENIHFREGSPFWCAVGTKA
jgi:SAM-dependent methyltransferase